jgi:FAD-linked sulfhydryl oxidase
MSINSDYWGSSGWKLLHYITLSYPDRPTTRDRTNMKNFFNSFQTVIPCKTCSNNFKKHMKKIPLTDTVLSSKQNLDRWLIDIHNETNKLAGKPVLSYTSALSLYPTE